MSAVLICNKNWLNKAKSSSCFYTNLNIYKYIQLVIITIVIAVISGPHNFV